MLNTSVNIALWQILAKTNLTLLTTVYNLTSQMFSLWLDSFLSPSICYFHFPQCLPVVCFFKSFFFFKYIFLFLIHPCRIRGARWDQEDRWGRETFSLSLWVWGKWLFQYWGGGGIQDWSLNFIDSNLVTKTEDFIQNKFEIFHLFLEIIC